MAEGEGSGAEDRKPKSDEARSAFAVPPGVGVEAEAPDEDQATSEFSVPEGLASVPVEAEGSAFATPHTYSASQSPPAYTGSGFPVTRMKESLWQDRMRTVLRMPVDVRPVPEVSQKQAVETGPAVGRVLDLTLRIGELLLAGGEAAEDVEAAMFAVSRSYGLDRCEPTVTFTMLSITYQPSLVDDPISANRTVRRRGTDYNRLSAVFRLVNDISAHEVDMSLEDAYRRLAEIRRNRHPYPGWMLTAAAGLLAGAASTLVGGGVLVFFAAALGAVLGDRLAWFCAGRGLPEFYQFVVAAMPPAAMGVALKLTDLDVRSSAVITGGLFALLPGRALVAAVQDGLTGYYITASARLLEVMYLFIGIIMGVLVVLWIGLQFGSNPQPEDVLQIDQRPLLQIAASMVLVFTFAILLQQERSTVWIVTLNGGIAWVVYGALHYAGNIPPVPSTAVAAGLVGLFGQLLSRHRISSALPFVTAAIGPLLPGSATYYGLLLIAENRLNEGLASLTNAVAIALAIAIGVNLGSEMSRLFMRIPATASSAKRRSAKRTRGF
ncbi:threonine/serine ThrE exporter family protein [Streptomyces sp. NBC_00503]|uniref:threonine/serine ThrE exporter family protein n=1 Tax=Streptomyces sp. NBC_00503 TaxID=2903659 RepID=UPI002E7FEDE3|nr:threonine/serine exporter family protein [Streptomyces sp. NBC_00503]WUD82824.1 threonine/serine exporter family protein [Streptomyces sp. NBC_00503]